MVNHGLVVAPLFLIVGLLAARAGGSEDIRDMGGIAFRAPVLAALFLIVALATLAMPGSANFVGEFLILLGVFQAKIVIAIVAFSGVVLAARLHAAAVHPDDAQPRRAERSSRARSLARRPRARAARASCILALALYPQFALHRVAGDGQAAGAPAQIAAAGDAGAPTAQTGVTP